MIKRFILLSAFLAICSGYLNAQINGVSHKKIISISHQVLEKGKAQFEPSIVLDFARYRWDENGDRQSLFATKDSIKTQQDVFLRMAYSFTDRFEVGAVINNNSSNWSFKRRLYNADRWGVSLLGGLNIPFGNEIIDLTQRKPNQSLNYVLGLAGSYQFFKVSSLDINLQYQDYLNSGELIPQSDLFVFADYGHYIHTSRVQLLVACSIHRSTFKNYSSNKWTYHQGVSIETKENYFLVIYANYDMWGKHTNKSVGFTAAWTISF